MARMTDAVLAKKARAYKAHKVEEATAKSAAAEIGKEILAELARRKIVTGGKVEKQGVRILKKASRVRIISVAAVKARLTRKLAQQVVVEEVDLGQWDALIKSGAITDVDVKECTVAIEERAPYIDVQLLD